MRNLINLEDDIQKDFADSVYTEFLRIRYGIKSGYTTADLKISTLRNDLLNWQLLDDDNELTKVSIQVQANLPVTFTDFSNRPHFKTNDCTESGPCGVQLGYNYGGGNANIIEVNSGGCITRINLNPAITINNSVQFTFTQPTPTTTWVINHKLGFVPNVWTKDSNGNDIEGVVVVIDNNTIEIFFNHPQSGTAYLS